MKNIKIEEKEKEKENEKIKYKSTEKEIDDSHENQVWKNTNLLSAISEILSEIINENKEDSANLNSKLSIKNIK